MRKKRDELRIRILPFQSIYTMLSSHWWCISQHYCVPIRYSFTIIFHGNYTSYFICVYTINQIDQLSQLSWSLTTYELL